MTEPAKDTAIDIAPKTQPTQGRVPKIVAEINRVASRVRDRNKKEEDHDAEVLENDGPAEITRIVRENTHPDKDKPQGRFAQISSRVIPLLVPDDVLPMTKLSPPENALSVSLSPIIT